METIIAPSMLSANFGNLAADIHMVNESEAGWFHVDVMDGHFVPNLTFGFPVIKYMKKLAQKPLDVHLMITNAELYVQEYKNAGADILTVHYEAITHLHRTIQQIKAAGMKTGIALNPHTPVSVLADIVHDADMILIMSVNPGFGGQKFIENTYKKLNDLQEMLLKANHTQCLVQVDGGVDVHNAAKLKAHGANVLVAGNAVFGAANPTEVIRKIKLA